MMTCVAGCVAELTNFNVEDAFVFLPLHSSFFLLKVSRLDFKGVST